MLVCLYVVGCVLWGVVALVFGWRCCRLSSVVGLRLVDLVVLVCCVGVWLCGVVSVEFSCGWCQLIVLVVLVCV